MTENKAEEYEVSDKVLTIPNLLSFIRLCTIPVFLCLLFDDHNLAATILFALAASTDWVDGQVARRTNSVSRLGQLLDPAVDRLLMISGVLGLFFVGRLPLWIILFVLIRDLLLLIGGSYLLSRYKVRVPVIYLGKVATTFLYIGFVGILLNWPLLLGLGWVDVSWLPFFNGDLYSWGYWAVYIGLILATTTTIYYISQGIKQMLAAKKKITSSGADNNG